MAYSFGIFLKKLGIIPCIVKENLIDYSGAVEITVVALMQEVATRSVALPRTRVGFLVELAYYFK